MVNQIYLAIFHLCLFGDLLLAVHSCRIKDFKVSVNGNQVWARWKLDLGQRNWGPCNDRFTLTITPHINNFPSTLSMTNICNNLNCRFQIRTAKPCVLYKVTLGDQTNTDQFIVLPSTMHEIDDYVTVTANSINVNKKFLEQFCGYSFTAVQIRLLSRPNLTPVTINQYEIQEENGTLHFPYRNNCSFMGWSNSFQRNEDDPSREDEEEDMQLELLYFPKSGRYTYNESIPIGRKQIIPEIVEIKANILGTNGFTLVSLQPFPLTYRVQVNGFTCDIVVDGYVKHTKLHFPQNCSESAFLLLSACAPYNASVHWNDGRCSSPPWNFSIWAMPDHTFDAIQNLETEVNLRNFTVKWTTQECSPNHTVDWNVDIFDYQKNKTVNFYCSNSIDGINEIRIRNNAAVCRNHSTRNVIENESCGTYQITIVPYYNQLISGQRKQINVSTTMSSSDITNMKAVKVTGRSFKLQWSISRKCQLPSAVPVFIGEKELNRSFNCTNEGDTLQCLMDVRSSETNPITPCQRYQIKIGDQSVEVATLPDITNLRAVNVTDRSFKLQWSMPRKCQLPSAVPVFIGEKELNRSFSCTNEGDTLQCLMDVWSGETNPITPCQLYHIKIGNQSVEVATLPDITNLRAVNVTDRSFKLQWSMSRKCQLPSAVPVFIGEKELNQSFNCTDEGETLQCLMDVRSSETIPITPCQRYHVKVGDELIEVYTRTDVHLCRLDVIQANGSFLLFWETIPDQSPCLKICELRLKRNNITAVRSDCQKLENPFNLGELETDANFTITLKIYDAYEHLVLEKKRDFHYKNEGANLNNTLQRNAATSILGVIVALLLVILALCGFKFYQRNSLQITFGNQKTASTDEILHKNSKNDEPAEVEHSISLNVLMNEENCRLGNELNELQRAAGSLSYDQQVARRPELKHKNRYANILPYDYNRVVLLPLPNDKFSDYINASYVKGFNREKEFIAAQGPLPSTVDDFWRMVWEQNVEIIVMLTSVIEGGKIKCTKYWPDEENVEVYHNIRVKPVFVQRYGNYFVRQFMLTKGRTSRLVEQFHFTEWQDSDSPQEPEALIAFIEIIRNQIQILEIEAPIVVHCSAGVGRTGTYIALDELMHQANFQTHIDIFKTVLNLRHYRVNMVQTEVQYNFLHDCMSYYMRTRVKRPRKP